MQPEPTSPPTIAAASPGADLLHSALVEGGSQRLGPARRRQRRRSLGLSLLLQLLLAGAMLAALALGPPLIRPRPAPPMRLRVLSYFDPALPLPRLPPPRPAPPRALSPPAPPAPPPPAPPPASVSPAILVRRLAAALPLRLPPPPADPAARPRPAPAPRQLAPAVAPRRPGAFGDPRGLPPPPALPVPAPLLGAFAAARAPRPADPAPGAPPARAGFAAVAAAASAAPAGVIRAAGFGPGRAPAPAPPGRIQHPRAFASAPPPAVSIAAPPAPPAFEPPRILALPIPAYTAAAARHRIQGEVVLRARLGADGRVHILELTHRLGYGLDQSAIAAARQVRFRPARRQGEAVDWTVTMHVRFRLAY